MAITKEHWGDLCREAAVERDPEKLVKLNDEISSILQQASRATERAPIETENAQAGA